jgi:hypothetical protein
MVSFNKISQRWELEAYYVDRLGAGLKSVPFVELDNGAMAEVAVALGLLRHERPEVARDCVVMPMEIGPEGPVRWGIFFQIDVSAGRIGYDLFDELKARGCKLDEDLWGRVLREYQGMSVEAQSRAHGVTISGRIQKVVGKVKKSGVRRKNRGG